VALLALASLAGSCGGSGPGSCTPGMTWVCPCGDGAAGQQVCGTDGVYGECSCGTGGDAGVGDGPRPDGAPPLDAPAQTDGPGPSDGPVPSDAPAQWDVVPPSDGPVQTDALADRPPQTDGIVSTGCSAGAADQVFEQGMRGCKGTVSFANRATRCAAGSRVCTAAEWVARHGTTAPTYNYWTNDVLYGSGGPGACAADLVYQLGEWCDGTNPMRVCAAATDSLGNQCNWTGCGFNANTPNEYFGGCQNNPTAGALCCPN
jgi:hypothetical protein